jgi:3-demethoxyubiquinol 3-hydroxylase
MSKSAAKRKTSTPPSPRPLPGDLAEAQTIARMLRVNHAGEFGAQQIYAGQIAILGRGKIGKTLRHMAEQEEVHLRYFAKALTQRRVRPTALHPLWRILGTALGVGTALMGEKAAMACTVAVEEVIDEHYAQQLQKLQNLDEPELRKIIARFRAEEIEHKTIGEDHGAEDLVYFPLLRRAIRLGSKTAIWLSERI